MDESIKIPRSHPRYESLMMRELIVEGMEKGIVAKSGLIAHGRGEAFDYLYGEKTQPFAVTAERAAAAAIMLAERPVFSVNGNVAVLVPEDIAAIERECNIAIEVNLFYRTEERVRKIANFLRDHGVRRVLGENPDAEIPGLDHARRLCSRDGIYSADLVIVALEDGDRVKALRDMGKSIVCIDLNPLSRSARYGDITIVDNITRALRRVIDEYRALSPTLAEDILKDYSNNRVLADVLRFTARRLESLAEEMERGDMDDNTG